MSQKLFSLIFEKKLQLAPGTKVIPKEDFSILQTAFELLEEVKKGALEYKKLVTQEGEKEKELGFSQGFEEGLFSLNKHIVMLDQELKSLREEVQKKILPLALMAAKKLLSEELRLHPDRIVDIILTSLKPVTQHRKITIYINKQDLEQLEKNKPKIKAIFEHLESLVIQERDDIEPGGCMIETEAGIINAQLENQWATLKTVFESFMKK